LDELKVFLENDLAADEPVPEWVFRTIDILSTIEDSMTLSRVQLRKIFKASELYMLIMID
jgi:hypothetical protein